MPSSATTRNPVHASELREIFDRGWKSRRVQSLTRPEQSPEREISRAVVAIYKAYLDRGPTRAQTTISREMVVCTLEGSLSRAERLLVFSERAPAVREIRRTYQDAMRDEIVKAVERVTGRRAEAFLSDHDPEPDVAVEAIKLVPLERPETAAALTDRSV